MKKLPLRPNVCMLLFNEKHKLFLGQRAGNTGVWQFPQGGVEKKYSLKSNVVRELHEETGADKEKFRIIKKLKATHRYEFSHIPHYAKDRWRGQKQTFWLVEFLGKDKDFDLDRFNPEFSNFKWCTPKQVRRFAERKRRPGYEKPLREFEKYLAQLSKLKKKSNF